MVKAALDVVAFPDEMTSFLGIGAEKLLSRPAVRWVDSKPVVVCDDPEVFNQAQQSIEETGRLLRGVSSSMDLLLLPDFRSRVEFSLAR